MNDPMCALIVSALFATAQPGFVSASAGLPLQALDFGPDTTDVTLVAPLGPGELRQVHSHAPEQIGLVAPVCSVFDALTPKAARDLIEQVAIKEHFDANLLIAVAYTESRFHVEAISPKGAIGLMQLMPGTAARFGVDPCDTSENILGGIRYLKYLQTRYSNPFYVLAAYNAGEEAVDRNHGIPPFPETVAYVAQVLDATYAWPMPGSPASRAKSEQSPEPRPGWQPDAWSQGFVMHVTSTEN